MGAKCWIDILKRLAALIITAPMTGCGSVAKITNSMATSRVDDSSRSRTADRIVPTRQPGQAVGSRDAGNATDRDGEGHTIDTTLATVIGALRKDLVGSGSIDGQAITDVQRQSRCETAFVTAQERTVIHWAKVGDLAAHSGAGQVSIPIDDGTGEHTISLPDGDTSRGLDGALGLLADRCAS